MIVQERFSQPDTIYVFLTSKCNHECSFCSGHDRMMAADSSEDVQIKLIEEALAKFPDVRSFNWSGGEPLLAWKRFQHLHDFIDAARPGAEHSLMTNGVKLRWKHYERLKDFKTVNVSIDGLKRGERPLEVFLRERAFEAFEVVKELNNAGTWAVVTREQLEYPDWYEDLLELHDAIYHLGFKYHNIQIDKHMIAPLTERHVDNFLAGYDKIRNAINTLDGLNGDFRPCSIERIFNSPCNRCSTVYEIDSSGRTGQTPNAEVVVQNGCNELAKAIGAEAYNRILATLE